MKKNFLTKSATELFQDLKSGILKSSDLVQASFDLIETTDSKIKSFISYQKEEALKKAFDIDQKFLAGDDLPMFSGIPIAIKDNICIKGGKTTCASKILENFISPYNATVISKLNQNNLIILGKTNLDEFAMGASTENSAFFKTRNPWNLNFVPGGSSGGSATAIASYQSTLALGSDTGGSIRQPASFCGVVGLKPTYGLVSRYGLIAYASSLDQIGPMAKTTEDVAHLLNIIAGKDTKDSTSVNVPIPDFTASLGQDISGLKIGIPKEFYNSSNISMDINIALNNTLKFFENNGASWEETDLLDFEHSIPTFYIIAPAEASSNLARFDGVRYGFRTSEATNLDELYKKTRGQGFGHEVIRRIIIGTFVLSAGYYDAYYSKAQKVRAKIKSNFLKAFEKYDFIITPTTPTPAFKIGEKTTNPLDMYLADIATCSINLAGLPAISIPMGISQNGLPLGLQIIAKHWDEKNLLKIAYFFEQNAGINCKLPISKLGALS